MRLKMIHWFATPVRERTHGPSFKRHARTKVRCYYVTNLALTAPICNIIRRSLYLTVVVPDRTRTCKTVQVIWVSFFFFNVLKVGTGVEPIVGAMDEDEELETKVHLKAALALENGAKSPVLFRWETGPSANKTTGYLQL